MSFKYINPGYAGLLQNQNPSYKANVVNATGKSKTGKAFTCRQFNFFKIPSTLANDEIWLKCDAYITKKRSLYFGEGYGTNSLQNGVNFSMGDSSFSLYIWYSHYSSQLTSIYYTDDIAAETGLKLDAINSIWLHIKYGDAGTGFLELQINNKRFDKIQDRKFSADDKTFGVIDTYASNTACFSNIIVSDEYVDPYEEIISLPITSTETDMTFNSDTEIYTATATNQTLMSSVDLETVINDYGSDSKVTGIALIGNPAYEADGIVTNLTSLTKANETVTEHETITLSSTSTDAIGSSITTDTTLANLAGIQYGWKAGV